MSFFQIGEKQLSTSECHVMGILNVTPDSFSDGGQYTSLALAQQQAEKMIAAGVALIDIGGESTRPNAEPVSVQQELDRVLPVVEKLVQTTDALISVDTSTPEVMVESAKLGAHLINDVRALQRPGALPAAVQTGLPVCLMHMQGSPQTMQDQPQYADVVDEVSAFLANRLDVCEQAGIDRSKIILDPGFGFGKTLAHNLTLLNQLERFEALKCPLLVGMSRKSMISGVLNKPVEQRLYGSIALASAAIMKNAFIVRVHDVEASVDAVKMLNAVKRESAIRKEEQL
jgi:dihydropteroate synthase